VLTKECLLIIVPLLVYVATVMFVLWTLAMTFPVR
jgi:hypothetical protein